MHPSDQPPPTPGRPSLINSDDEDSANRPRIVGGLDCLDGEPAAKWGLARFPWALCGALMLAIGAATMLWSGDESGKQIIVAGTEPVIAEPPPLQNSAADELLDSDAAPPILVKETTPAAELAPPTVKRIELKRAPRAIEHRAKAAKPAKMVTSKRKGKAPMPVKRKPILSRTELMSQADKEVALLAAMVTHTKATTSGPSPFLVKWKQCGAARSVAAAKQCRVILCAESADAVECRGARGSGAGIRP
ncbi:hypothetical protein [Massilia sp. CF038]|uniref:hypothetical protein n=1 Tax=Massilia sp. CF038 TaxID=1881045 RepID=UPI0009170D29|nr:hypothetical protein [Massilia sp. CF038]SHG65639.1 hypothetical protein SAMN05428948_1476 [Massilia sp. CF038]